MSVQVDLNSIRIDKVFDLQHPQSFEEEIYGYLYTKTKTLGFENKTYSTFVNEVLSNKSYDEANLPFCVIEAGEIDYDNVFRKNLNGVNVITAKQSFYVGFYDTNIIQLLKLRQSFVKALYDGGFNSNIDNEIYFRMSFDTSILFSLQEVKRLLRDIVFKLDFTYNINYKREESLLIVDKALIGSDFTEINYVEINKEEE